MQPLSITATQTVEGCHKLIARYPIVVAMRARHLPNMAHEGRTYAPYTGTVVAPYRGNVTAERPEGFYMEYRALRVF